jgi:hypothetical protein
MNTGRWTKLKKIVIPNVIHHRRNALESNSLRVFENRVLRRLFGPIRDEVIGGWRKLQHEQLHNLYSSSS